VFFNDRMEAVLLIRLQICTIDMNLAEHFSNRAVDIEERILKVLDS